jgi:hypothetical protein
MRFRIRAKNPRTQQAHDFEVEGDSLRDARDKVEDAGLVPSKIEPAADPAPPAEGADPKRRPRRKLVPRRKRRVVNGILLLGIMVAVAATVPAVLSGSATTFESLDAVIRFDGFQFKITNKDDFAWYDVRIDVNGGLTHSGYLHRPGTLVGRQIYTAPATAFSDEDGNRFNPVTDSPRQMTITCDLEDGKTARYTKRWN